MKTINEMTESELDAYACEIRLDITQLRDMGEPLLVSVAANQLRRVRARQTYLKDKPIWDSIK